ncbi:MAG: hypothetical protein WAS21_11525 [Geminicoccaceae bacterium]
MSEEELERVWTDLLAGRSRAPTTVIGKPGIYALFLTDPARLKDLAFGPDGLLYIGKAGKRLKRRYHFAHTDSARSSPRRSLGALLKQELGLQAIPRGSKNAAADFDRYRFTPEGEACLTTWMKAYLDYAFVVVEQKTISIEKKLIAAKKPPLNLTDWDNPQAPFIEARRRHCRDKAKGAHKMGVEVTA